MSAAILFSTTWKPTSRIDGFASTDEMGFRLTRGQGLFRMYGHTHCNGLHLIAQNVSAPSVILENPTRDLFIEEVRRGYPVVALSFKLLDVEKLLEMCTVVRKESPSSKIVLGGYGAVCGAEALAEAKWKGKFDAVCTGEGVAFMRQLLDDSVGDGLQCRLPRIGSTLPWLSARAVGTIGIVLSGLGCSYRCPFCVTSAATDGRYVECMTADDVFRTMRGYWAASATTNSVTIYDENFLEYRDKVGALGKLIREDADLGLRRLNYFSFGSLSALARYEPEELLLNGLDTLWIGVESRLSPLTKRKGTDPREAFHMLASIGIKTVGSWILGEDFQTPDNISEDADFFMSLEPAFQQFSLLSAGPPAPLYYQLRRAGRIPPDSDWSQQNIYGNTVMFRHFSHAEALAHVDAMYRRIYHEQGPALMKVLGVNLQGYEFCVRSKHPLLKKDKAAFFQQRCQSYYPFLRTAIVHAPTPAVARRMEELDERCRTVFGAPDPAVVKMSELILARADREAVRLENAPEPAREEPSRRYTYPARGERTPLRPYTVEYPDGDPWVAGPIAGRSGAARA